MYQGIGRGAAKSALIVATTTAGGAAVLPYTVANPLGTLLAYIAITIGLAVLASQAAVRILRVAYKK